MKLFPVLMVGVHEPIKHEREGTDNNSECKTANKIIPRPKLLIVSSFSLFFFRNVCVCGVPAAVTFHSGAAGGTTAVEHIYYYFTYSQKRPLRGLFARCGSKGILHLQVGSY